MSYGSEEKALSCVERLPIKHSTRFITAAHESVRYLYYIPQKQSQMAVELYYRLLSRL